MIEVNKNTSKYNVNPRYMISDTFEDGYKRFANEQVAAPPDKVSLIATALSFILLIAILILTSFTYKDQFYVWLALAALCVILLLRSVMKYTKARKEYLKAAGKPTTISKKRKRFYSLFSDGENLSDLPNVMSAGEFLPIVARLMGKQEEQLYNGVLRTIHEKLAAINNPNLPMAKIITPFGDVFNQTKRRLYVVEEDNKLIFFDADWIWRTLYRLDAFHSILPILILQAAVRLSLTLLLLRLKTRLTIFILKWYQIYTITLRRCFLLNLKRNKL